MSATFFNPAQPAERTPPTTDLESTTDLNGHTTDLSPVTPVTPVTPATTDIEPAEFSAEPSAEIPAAVSAEVVAASQLQRVEREPRGRHPAAPAPLAPGAVLCDRFILERVVGSGGTAIVYQARDLSAQGDGSAKVRVAVKVPRADRRERERAATRLHHEFAQARKLSHPSIVRVFELIEHDDSYFMTMELIEGRLLATIVRDWTMLPRALANKIMRSCALALQHAHEHDVVHGDFKPGNVFLTREEEVKIVDFGAAAALSGDSSRIPAGTPAYASPQVLSGETPDRRDDVFSFACVAYEVLTGQHPFQHRSSLDARDAGVTPTRAWNLSAPQWLGLLSALSWDREQRPADIMTLLESLLTEAEPIALAPPIQPVGNLVTTELPHELIPAQRGWGFFAFVACAIVMIFIAVQRQDGPDQDETAIDSAVAHEAATEPGALPPLTNSIAGSVERPRDGLALGNPESSFAADAQLAAASHPALVSPAPASQPIPAPDKPASAPRGPLSEISFDSNSIVTTEGSVAAVFLIKRSQPLRGRVRVQWIAKSGTADAGIDFASEASGSVEFADGQAQRAIYVPLRNDLLKEGDETFTVQLVSPQNAKLGANAKATATIRDDD
jgi:serine/threonine protein kinase